MSDVSEHDSDSDTEISRKVKQADPPPLQPPQQNSQSKQQIHQHSSTVEQPEVPTSESSVNVLEDLKQQAATVTASEQKPEWQQYLEQNHQTGSYTYTDPSDGTVYEWDATKKGWIPKIDDDFIALYQANYGFTATGEHDPNINVEPEAPVDEAAQKKPLSKNKQDGPGESGKKRKAEEKKEWFDIDPKKNNNVYVSGLPESTTDEDFDALMSKCGIIMMDDAGKKKLKLYRTADGKVKGDGRCCYLKNESVELACNLLDESDVDGSKIHVELAVFELKGSFDPTKKPKKKKQKKKKPGGGQDKLLDWVDRPKKRSKFDRIVILKDMFDQKEFEKDPTLINDLKADLRTEGEKFGDVKKIMVFDRNSEGVASILFHEPEMADKCIEALNGRFYGGRTISAATYDGVTKYDVQETEEEMQKRLDDWERFIGGEEEDDNNTAVTS